MNEIKNYSLIVAAGKFEDIFDCLKNGSRIFLRPLDFVNSPFHQSMIILYISFGKKRNFDGLSLIKWEKHSEDESAADKICTANHKVNRSITLNKKSAHV